MSSPILLRRHQHRIKGTKPALWQEIQQDQPACARKLIWVQPSCAPPHQAAAGATVPDLLAEDAESAPSRHERCVSQTAEALAPTLHDVREPDSL